MADTPSPDVSARRSSVPGTPNPGLRHLLVTLNADPELGRNSICRLALGAEAWRRLPANAEADAAAGALGVSPKALTVALELRRHATATARRESRRTRRLGARIVTWLDAAYPTALFDLELPPPVLYVEGELPRRPAVAIVGSRRTDAYGAEAAELFGRGLAERGLAIVSGFAVGVDTAAHRGALAVDWGRTVAVLGCGLDVDYPRGHRRLAERVTARGARLSEFPPGSPPFPSNFPIRNRIIAALSVGTLVARAAVRSGSLITARLALELGREVWALPGEVFDRLARGPNLLIRDGAGLVERPRDVVEGLSLAVRDRLVAARERAGDEPPGDDQGVVLAALERGRPAAPEALAERSGLAIERVLATLVELELAGLARRYPGPAFSRGGGR